MTDEHRVLSQASVISSFFMRMCRSNFEKLVNVYFRCSLDGSMPVLALHNPGPKKSGQRDA